MKDHVQPLKKHKESDRCTSSPAFAWLLLLSEAAEYPLQENDTAVVDLYSVFAWDSLYLSKLSNVEFCANIRRAEKQLARVKSEHKTSTRPHKEPTCKIGIQWNTNSNFRHWCGYAILECKWWLCLKFHAMSRIIMLYVGVGTGFHVGPQHAVIKTVYS